MIYYKGIVYNITQDQNDRMQLHDALNKNITDANISALHKAISEQDTQTLLNYPHYGFTSRASHPKDQFKQPIPPQTDERNAIFKHNPAHSQFAIYTEVDHHYLSLTLSVKPFELVFVTILNNNKQINKHKVFKKVYTLDGPINYFTRELERKLLVDYKGKIEIYKDDNNHIVFNLV